MLAQIIITKGYLWTVALILALYLSVKSNGIVPIPLDNRRKVDPLVAINIEAILARALAVGLFLVAINVLLPALVPGAKPSFIEGLFR